MPWGLHQGAKCAGVEPVEEGGLSEHGCPEDFVISNFQSQKAIALKFSILLFYLHVSPLSS